MEKLTLSAFVGKFGQASAANLLGVRQSAISKALRVGRDIFIIVHPGGRLEAKEIKAFPSQQRDVVHASNCGKTVPDPAHESSRA